MEQEQKARYMPGVHLGQGEIIESSPSPFILSLHNELTQHGKPFTLMTGCEKVGKSYTAGVLTSQMVEEGAYVLCINPRNDPAYSDVDSTEIDLSLDYEGILDPFSFFPDDAIFRLDLIFDLVTSMAGKLSREERKALNSAITYAMYEEVPSLGKMMKDLLGSPLGVDQKLGEELRKMSEQKYAGLMFSPRKGKGITLKKGMTNVSLQGITLPPEDEVEANHTTSNKVALAVMGLLPMWAAELVEDISSVTPKSVIIEEAWACARTWESLIPLANSAQSSNTVTILITSSPEPFDCFPYSFLIGTRFVFKELLTKRALRAVMPLQALISTLDANMVLNLDVKECLIKTHGGSTFKVQVQKHFC